MGGGGGKESEGGGSNDAAGTASHKTRIRCQARPNTQVTSQLTLRKGKAKWEGGKSPEQQRLWVFLLIKLGLFWVDPRKGNWKKKNKLEKEIGKLPVRGDWIGPMLLVLGIKFVTFAKEGGGGESRISRWKWVSTPWEKTLRGGLWRGSGGQTRDLPHPGKDSHEKWGIVGWEVKP